jgi:pyruvate ferredoxin oxidoreductase delta subunit
MTTTGDGWKDLPLGAIIEKPGNAREYLTGDWRTMRPVWDPAKCIQCLFCWVYCPDASIIVKDGKMSGINYAHCKGCGICAAECPKRASAITMIRDADADAPGAAAPAAEAGKGGAC